ncbi:MarR family transcriptional regulator [Anaerocolumna sp. AGMB13025]|uniref:MarR family winged helix-turn-helix transcriptional regulator n=1 Tax=Anaerocolumna sp. AGMB13025 TaxID=3039116 RepID=UPI00241D6DA7|nr:MarR family transcriptional regulator [Anaerocolumna sp. AGMB13025]WFR59003.1 MarR family transcriptional regulator [Anaerocolumna sp. AGMB13025]
MKKAKTADLSKPLAEYGYYIQNLAKNIKYLADENLVKQNLTIEQVKILRFLREHNEEGSALQKEIEVYFKIKRSSVTSILQNMEKGGLLIREGIAADARIKKVCLTKKGQDLSISLVGFILNLEEVIVDGMSLEERAVFAELLKKSLNNVEKLM